MIKIFPTCMSKVSCICSSNLEKLPFFGKHGQKFTLIVNVQLRDARNISRGRGWKKSLLDPYGPIWVKMLWTCSTALVCSSKEAIFKRSIVSFLISIIYSKTKTEVN